MMILFECVTVFSYPSLAVALIAKEGMPTGTTHELSYTLVQPNVATDVDAAVVPGGVIVIFNAVISAKPKGSVTTERTYLVVPPITFVVLIPNG